MKKLLVYFAILLIVTPLGSIFAQDPEVLGVSVDATDEEKAIALVKPSVVKIATTYCGRFRLDRSTASLKLPKSQYEFCTAGTGSGFVISSDGFVATNGHVVKFSEDDKLRTAFYSEQVIDLYIDLYAAIELEKSGKIITSFDKQNLKQALIADQEAYKEAIDNMYTFYQQGYIELETDKEEIFVQKDDVFEFDKNVKLTNKSEQYAATLKGIDYEQFEVSKDNEVTFKSSDVAILKIEASGLPAVDLGTVDDVNVGSPLIVLGFPGKANSPLTSEDSQGEVTITQGIVSAIKDEAGGERRLIQTDASLGHGNSGGPAIDKNGKVIGIATYVSIPSAQGDEAADFNFLRDIADLKKLADTNNVSYGQSEIDTAWKSGLELFWQYKFTKALEEFEKVKNLNPEHALVQDYIDRANEGIENGEEVKGWRDSLDNYVSRESQPLVFGIVGGICLVSIVGLIFLIFVRKGFKKRKNGMNFEGGSIPQMPPVQPQPTIQPIGLSPSTSKQEEVNEDRFMPQMGNELTTQPVETAAQPVIPVLVDEAPTVEAVMPNREEIKNEESQKDLQSHIADPMKMEDETPGMATAAVDQQFTDENKDEIPEVKPTISEVTVKSEETPVSEDLDLDEIVKSDMEDIFSNNQITNDQIPKEEVSNNQIPNSQTPNDEVPVAQTPVAFPGEESEQTPTVQESIEKKEEIPADVVTTAIHQDEVPLELKEETEAPLAEENVMVEPESKDYKIEDAAEGDNKQIPPPAPEPITPEETPEVSEDDLPDWLKPSA